MPQGFYGYPPAMPIWGYPGYGSNGVPPPSQYFGMQPLMTNTLSIPNNITTPNITTTSSTTSVIIPNIVDWFSYLDQHEECNKDGITFAPYRIALKAKGFLQISQLT